MVTAKPSRRSSLGRRTGSATAVLALVAVLGGGVLAQGGVDDVAESAMDDLKSAIKAEHPSAILDALGTLDEVYDQVDPKVGARIGKAVAGVFKIVPGLKSGRVVDDSSKSGQKNVPRADDGAPLVRGGGDRGNTSWGRTYTPSSGGDEGGAVEDPREAWFRVYGAAIGVLYERPEGQKQLTAALKLKHVKSWTDVQASIVEALGYRREADNLKLFAGYLTDENARIVVSATRALGEFEDADQAVRKRAVKELMDAYEDLTKEAEREAKKGREEVARDHLIIVESGFDKALYALTGERLNGAEAWSDWLSKDGKKEGW